MVNISTSLGNIYKHFGSILLNILSVILFELFSRYNGQFPDLNINQAYKIIPNVTFESEFSFQF